MPNKEFLEKYPLYRKYKINLPLTMDELAKPAIHMHCQVCKSDQTFNMINNYYENYEYRNVPLRQQIVRAVYSCSACNEFPRLFYIRFDDQGSSMMKVGQYPPWEIAPDSKIEHMLGTHSDYYKKGLICESQGFGIGAFVYYRRIVEEVVDNLLDEIADLMVGDDKVKYLEALEKTKNTIVAQEKIAIVKDLLPPILKPEGMNPLATLHSTLSEGLHDTSDEACMESAMAVREVLVFLVNQVALSKAASKSFTDHMKKLLQKKK